MDPPARVDVRRFDQGVWLDFHRSFVKRYGCTPGEFRQRGRARTTE